MLKAAFVFAVVLAGASTVSGAQSREILIMGGASQDKFLGCLTCSEHAAGSVWNDYDTHGWANKYATWNRYGENANPYAGHSACNQYATEGPVLVDRQGNYYGRLSVNPNAADSICGVTGVPRICTALKVMCADN